MGITKRRIVAGTGSKNSIIYNQHSQTFSDKKSLYTKQMHVVFATKQVSKHAGIHIACLQIVFMQYMPTICASQTKLAMSKACLCKPHWEIYHR